VLGERGIQLPTQRGMTAQEPRERGHRGISCC
jgi:hypothetical protein